MSVPQSQLYLSHYKRFSRSRQWVSLNHPLLLSRRSIASPDQCRRRSSAQQGTIVTPGGRCVVIGWMQNWDTCQPRGSSWLGQMTVPRELSFRDGRVIQNPIRELEQRNLLVSAYFNHGTWFSSLLRQLGMENRSLDPPPSHQLQPTFLFLQRFLPRTRHSPRIGSSTAVVVEVLVGDCGTQHHELAEADEEDGQTDHGRGDFASEFEDNGTLGLLRSHACTQMANRPSVPFLKLVSLLSYPAQSGWMCSATCFLISSMSFPSAEASSTRLT